MQLSSKSYDLAYYAELLSDPPVKRTSVKDVT